MEEREEFLQTICEEHPIELVLSSPVHKQQEVQKIMIRLIRGRHGLHYQLEKFTRQQAFHMNIADTDLYAGLMEYFGTQFLQLNAWTKDWEYRGKITKKGKFLHNRQAHDRTLQIRQGYNREKQYCIPEGTIVPPLIDMGIFSKDGKVVQSKYDKYRQINRFLEVVDDVLHVLPKDEIHVVDFGCGKSYLTFLLYYYLVEVKQMNVAITGLDLKETVIEECRRTAEKYHYENLHFQHGDIHSYQTDQPIDMVISLHACDTATDYALYHAINRQAKVILSVPCCQHECNQQLQSERLAIFSRYGIIKERTAALMTDAIRGNLLEYCGYKTQLLEFIDMEHSPKNILIRAIKTQVPQRRAEQARKEVEELMETFHLKPTLYQLLLGEEA